MTLTTDMKDLIMLLQKHEVKYLLIGGFAVICYGYVRTTQDIDFLIYPSEENSKNMMKALVEFGFGNAGIPASYFEHGESAIHLGVEPNRIDLLTSLQGISNDSIFDNMKQVNYDGICINIISRDDLIKSKKVSGRLKDLADVEELEKISAD
jgi:predicted nucleotidyltransferase